MKNSKWIGLLAGISLIISCFLHWAYYADLHTFFTGFFSEQNMYGKPGKFLVFFALASICLLFMQKVWASRVNLFLSALFTGYAVKTYILFVSCYNAYCPEKQPGIYLMLISCILLLIVSIFPGIHLKEKSES